MISSGTARLQRKAVQESSPVSHRAGLPPPPSLMQLTGHIVILGRAFDPGECLEN